MEKVCPLQDQKKSKRFGIQGRLGVMLAAFVLLTGLSIALIGHEAIRSTEITLTGMLANNITQALLGKIESSIYEPALRITNSMSRSALSGVFDREKRLRFVPWLNIFMDNYPIVDGTRVGYKNGDYLVLRRLSGDEKISREPPPNSAFMLVIYEHENNGTTLSVFYDTDMNVLASHSEAGQFNYDPRESSWYRSAMESEEPVETDPIRTPVSGQPAMIFSQKAQNGEAVVGADIVLTRLSVYLEKIRPTPGANIGLFRQNGLAITSTQTGAASEGLNAPGVGDEMTPILEMGFQEYFAGKRGLDIKFKALGEAWVLFLEELIHGNQIKNVVVLALPKGEILDESIYFPRRVAYVSLGLLIALSPFLYLYARFIFEPLRKLATLAREVKDNPLIAKERVVSSVAEIQDLSEGMEYMQANIQTLLSITGTINREKDFQSLIVLILDEIMLMTGSDGGAIVLLTNEGDEEKNGMACWNSGQRKRRYFPIEPRHMEELGLPVTGASQSNLSHDFIERSDPRASSYFIAGGFADSDATQIDVLREPLYDRMDEPLGEFVLARRIHTCREFYLPQQLELAEGLAKTAAIALDNHRLFEKQRELLNSVIQVMAGAIDAKSPHTSRHCARVPVLFQMLLQAACDEKEGPFADFALDANGWEETRIAAWLHDWGKVTTPEFVIDKAMRLDAMYNRIHEIRTRFEVLKRDEEIACLNAILHGGDKAGERAKLQANLLKLDEEFAFIADCNRGTSVTSGDTLARLQLIGSRTWLRTLDKSLGLSREELARMERSSAPGTPAIERLLSDNPEHLIEHPPGSIIPSDNPWGIKITAPRYLYNRGELHNLSIRTGTITAEERYKINDHVTQTIIMLDKVPLPKHLKNVANIAGAHHETMLGTGYPKKLVREEMSWPARMLAVSDIFEALTASDRPYKPYNTLTEALRILESFEKENRIDKDVLELFLRANIPQKYASQHLRPDQNDLP